MLPATSDRVRRHTSKEINRRIQRETEERIAECLWHGPAAIDQRMAELDEEWDVERCLETVAPSITLVGLTLGAMHSRKWLIIPAVVQSFFLQHALQGWCPPLPVLRRLGIRTIEEIEIERYALKALRGDFDKLAMVPSTAPNSRMQAAVGAARNSRN